MYFRLGTVTEYDLLDMSHAMDRIKHIRTYLGISGTNDTLTECVKDCDPHGYHICLFFVVGANKFRETILGSSSNMFNVDVNFSFYAK